MTDRVSGTVEQLRSGTVGCTGFVIVWHDPDGEREPWGWYPIDKVWGWLDNRCTYELVRFG